MKEIDRRDFIKSVAIGGAVLAIGDALIPKPMEAAASDGQVEVLYLGHSTFRITSTTGKVIVIDPYLKRNPRTPAKYKDLSALGKVDLILVTHGHGDHFADLPDLAKLTGATVVANYELVNNLVSLGFLDGAKAIGMNKGGTVAPLGPGIKVHMVAASKGLFNSTFPVARTAPPIATVFMKSLRSISFMASSPHHKCG